MNEWKRVKIYLPKRTISGRWIYFTDAWQRLKYEIGTQVEYEINPDGLETEYQKDQIKKLLSILGTDHHKKYPLTEGSTKTNVKAITGNTKPTAPPPPAVLPLGRVQYRETDDTFMVLTSNNPVKWTPLTSHASAHNEMLKEKVQQLRETLEADDISTRDFIVPLSPPLPPKGRSVK